MSPRTPSSAVFAPLAGVVAAAVTLASALSAQQPVDPSAFQALEWRNIGPAVMGGRIADIAVDESDVSTFYVASATGGLWKTTNNGASFTALFQGQAVSTIGDVTLAPSNPNEVWVGTGEPQNRQSSPWGNGVYRSRDGGKSWEHMGLENTLHIARIRIHPANPDIAYVAAVGHLWGPNPERGVYRTTDGGESWEKVLFVDEHTGAIDLAMDPRDPKTVYAAMYQRRRTGFGFNGGGPGGGIYRTLDGGDSWEELTNGLPEGNKGRIGIDVCRSDGSIVYAIVEAETGQGVYRSTDRGDTWTQMSDTNPRPMYYSQIRVDPNDDQQVYVLGSPFFRSSDGGRTFESVEWPGVHVDHHAFWIDPNDSDHLLLGNDGGVYASFDGSESWTMYDNIVVSQFYEIGVDMRDPYWVCGGLQDNGSWCGPSATYSEVGILNGHWQNIYGGDGYYAQIDPNDHTIIFAESQNGRPARVDLVTGERTRIQPVAFPEDPDGEGRELRWNWDTPIVMSGHDPSVVYYGANILFRSRDRGGSWEEASPDLTKGIDRDTLEIMGVELADVKLSRNDGISSYGNITQIAESPLDAHVLYVGTDDANVQVTRDGGASWTNVVGRIPELPSRTYVSGLVASRHTEGRLYATFDGHRNDDYRAYVYVSENYGEGWRRITRGLPETSVNRIEEHPRNPNLLFVANEVGLFFSIDRGGQWTRLENNLPTVPVDDIVIHPRDNDLIIGTHGRGIWIIDDITPLEQLTPALLASPAHLFPVQTVRTINRHGMDGRNAGAFAAPNPPEGTVIRYYLGQPARAVATTGDDGEDGDDGDGQKVTVAILDATGETVRTLQGLGSQGMHQVVWDLRYEPPYEPEQPPSFFGGPRGPRVLPGIYTATLDIGGQNLSTRVPVEGDPRINVTRADLDARQAALMTLYALERPLHEAGERLGEMQEHLSEIREILDQRTGAGELQSLKEEAMTLAEDADSLASSLQEHSRSVFTLFSAIEGSTIRPTEAQGWEVDRSWDRTTARIRELNEMLRTRLPALDRRLEEEGIRSGVGEPVELPGRPRRSLR